MDSLPPGDDAARARANRLDLLANRLHDAAARYRLLARALRDRLPALFRDASARFGLIGSGHRDHGARFRVLAPGETPEEVEERQQQSLLAHILRRVPEIKRLTGRIRGRKKISQKDARRLLLELADLADTAGNPIDAYTLSQHTTRSARTINYWLNRADWSIEELRIQLQRYRRRQSAKRPN
jgi:hypothetical protein